MPGLLKVPRLLEMPFKDIPSLAETIPALQKRMTLTALILFPALAVLIISNMLFTDHPGWLMGRFFVTLWSQPGLDSPQ